jgi:putative ABC transport system permease protein
LKVKNLGMRKFLFIKLFGESFLFAFHALTSNKLRAFLSLLGISIGIFAVISVFTVVDDLAANFKNSVASLGSSTIYIQKRPWIGDPELWWKYKSRPSMSFYEADEILKRSSAAQYASFVTYIGGKIVKRKNNNVENALITAVTSGFDKIKSFELSDGRYFTDGEFSNGKPITVIGAGIAEALFPFSESPIGKEINVMGRKMQVIGVFKKEGQSISGNSMDDQVLISINYARNVVDIKSDRGQSMIMVKAKDKITNAELSDDLKGVMRSIRKLKPTEDDNFALNESGLILSKLDSIFAFINKAGWVIGGFSILVGGFGIANIMFVSVKERTNIIGIQKSLGAKSYFILLQFLVESLVLSLMGGVLGLFFTYLGTLIAGVIWNYHPSLTIGNIELGLFVSSIIGVVSGFMPAYSASKMDPVEAIRAN